MSNIVTRVKQAASAAEFHEKEAARYNKILNELIHEMSKGKGCRPFRSETKTARKRKPMPIEGAKINVFAFIRNSKTPSSISQIWDGVPHSFTTTKRALKSLQLANKIKHSRMVGGNGKPYQGWSEV